MISPKHKFKFKNELYSFDATVIDLGLGAFPRASFRRTKSAIKVYTLMNHSGYLPAFPLLFPLPMAKSTNPRLLQRISGKKAPSLRGSCIHRLCLVCPAAAKGSMLRSNHNAIRHQGSFAPSPFAQSWVWRSANKETLRLS